MKLQEPPRPDYRVTGTLMDDAGQALTKPLYVNLSPASGSGNFRLPPGTDAAKIQTATQLQTTDGKQFRIIGLKFNPGYQSITGNDQPYFEFRYEAK